MLIAFKSVDFVCVCCYERDEGVGFVVILLIVLYLVVSVIAFMLLRADCYLIYL